MKLVVVYVRPEMVNDVIYALHDVEGVRGVSAYEGRGFGAWRLEDPLEAAQREGDDFRAHVRLETVCSDETAKKVMRTIIESAQTGMTGDGIVYAVDVVECIRIRTGEIDKDIIKRRSS